MACAYVYHNVEWDFPNFPWKSTKAQGRDQLHCSQASPVFSAHISLSCCCSIRQPQTAPVPSWVTFSPWASQRRREAFTHGCLEVWGVNILRTPTDNRLKLWWSKAPHESPEDNCVVYFMWLFRKSIIGALAVATSRVPWRHTWNPTTCPLPHASGLDFWRDQGADTPTRS